jgi:hypothetical protein
MCVIATVDDNFSKSSMTADAGILTVLARSPTGSFDIDLFQRINTEKVGHKLTYDNIPLISKILFYKTLYYTKGNISLYPNQC